MSRAMSSTRPAPAAMRSIAASTRASRSGRRRRINSDSTAGIEISPLHDVHTSCSGTRAFQLLIIPGGGRVNAWRPFSKSDDAKSAPYVPKYAGVDLAPITSVANGWTLFDLRPLRADLSAGRIGPIDRGLEALLWGYDGVLVIPSATAAKNLD